MKIIIKLEEPGMFLLSLLMFMHSGFAWWLFPVLLLAPDISMIGYGINSRFGALLYNMFHHKGIAVLFFGIDILPGNRIWYSSAQYNLVMLPGIVFSVTD